MSDVLPVTNMDRKQKIITTVLWGVLVVAMLGVVGTGLWARYGDAIRSPRIEPGCKQH